MTIGPAQVLTCPHCGNKKYILSLMSGNTFGSKMWSDGKVFSPMMPEISMVQRCPDCKAYYILARQEYVVDEQVSTFERGLLSLIELKEAWEQLSQEGFESSQEEATVRMMLHRAFVDEYMREVDDVAIEPDEQAAFASNALWLIDNYISDNLLKVEFYREIGMMDKAQEALQALPIETKDFRAKLQQDIASRIAAGSRTVFLIR